MGERSSTYCGNVLWPRESRLTKPRGEPAECKDTGWLIRPSPLVPSEIRGRTGSVQHAAASIVQLVSAASIGAAAATFGTRGAIGGAGVVQIVAVGGAVALLWRGWQAMRAV